MDPYLEQRWGDFHHSVIFCIKAALQDSLPPGLRARGEQDLLLEEGADDRDDIRFRGDIAVVERESFPNRSTSAGEAVAVVDPIVLRYRPQVEQHRWVQIIDISDGSRVITVIEVLSPGNKSSSELNKKYRKKLNQYTRAGVNIVEIDLLRSSRARLRVQSEEIEPARRADYYTCVNWAGDPDRWNVYPMPLRRPLPAIPIPCRETDPDVLFPLQPVIDRVYAAGGYDDIDYSKPPDPPFDAADAAWAAEQVNAAPPAV
jgi:hypothetical protein